MNKKVYLCTTEKLREQVQKEFLKDQERNGTRAVIADEIPQADMVYLVLPEQKEMEADLKLAHQLSVPIIRVNKQLMSIDLMNAILDNTLCLDNGII